MRSFMFDILQGDMTRSKVILTFTCLKMYIARSGDTSGSRTTLSFVQIGIFNPSSTHPHPEQWMFMHDSYAIAWSREVCNKTVPFFVLKAYIRGKFVFNYIHLCQGKWNLVRSENVKKIYAFYFALLHRWSCLWVEVEAIRFPASPQEARQT